MNRNLRVWYKYLEVASNWGVLSRSEVLAGGGAEVGGGLEALSIML